MVGPKRALKFIQLSSESIADDNIDTHTICCGACSWQGDLDELVESLTA